MNVVELKRVSVRYRTHRARSLKEYVIRGLRRQRQHDWFSSLSEIDLEVRSGESLGIIGNNGAGKSTLLRVAAGIVQPSEGIAIARGTIAPLIELGTGFEGELTGYENIYFNGALLGRSRAEIRAQFDEIVSFAAIDEFIDEPLRTYSTGMVARLAISIATALDAETLLLDEILAVGDASFREKCQVRMRGFVERGLTVVLVSHDVDVVRQLCTRAVWLEHGRIVADGPADEVIETYQAARIGARP